VITESNIYQLRECIYHPKYKYDNYLQKGNTRKEVSAKPINPKNVNTGSWNNSFFPFEER